MSARRVALGEGQKIDRSMIVPPKDGGRLARARKMQTVMIPDRAERVIAFIECLTVPSGKGAGDSFVLEEFQKEWIRDVYTPHYRESNLRIVRKAILSIARKNGKTAIIAAIVLVHLIGPEAIPNGEIYSCANDLEQAAVVFKFLTQMIELEAELSDLLHVIEHKKTVKAPNGSEYKALSRDSKTKHGKSPSVWVFDELGQAKDRELFDTMDTATGARDEPLGFVISTQSPDPESPMSQVVDDGLDPNDPTTVCHLYAVPEEWELEIDGDGNPVNDIFSEDAWRLANPALGAFCSYESLRIAADRARRNPAFENAYRNLHLNQRVSQNVPLITRTLWKSKLDNQCRLVEGEPIYLGLDLATSTDLAALVAVSAEKGTRVQSWFWTHSHELEQRSKTDRAPYATWKKQGLLEVSPGKIIDYAPIISFLDHLSKAYDVKGVGFDRWRIKEFEKDCAQEDVKIDVDPKDPELSDGIRFVSIGQGFRDMTTCIEKFEREMLSDEGLEHDGHPVLTYCIANAAPITDPAGNRKLDKSRRNLRIDGAVALLMAIGLKAKDLEGDVIDWDEIANNSVEVAT